jgi:hypothetical protein
MLDKQQQQQQQQQQRLETVSASIVMTDSKETELSHERTALHIFLDRLCIQNTRVSRKLEQAKWLVSLR